MKKMAYILFTIILCSCGADSNKQSTPIIYDLESDNFSELINHYTLNESVQFWQSKIVANKKYPLYFALFEKGKFLYELPGVGNGEGKWSLEKNQIKLVAKTSLFDMILYISTLNDIYYFKFKDRHGPQVYEAEILN